MNKHSTSLGVGGGLALFLGVSLLLLVGTDCRPKIQADGHPSTLLQTVGEFIAQLNDVAAHSPEFSNVLTSIVKEVKSALANLPIARANWFMQCLNNCMHHYDDMDNTTTTSSNITVEMMFKCNHKCIDIGAGNHIVGR